MTRGKQSVQKGIWYLQEKRRKIRTRIKIRQQGKVFPIGLIASAAAPLLGEIAKPIFKTILRRGRRKRRREKKYCCDDGLFKKKVTLPNRQTFYAKYEKRADKIYRGMLR